MLVIHTSYNDNSPQLSKDYHSSSNHQHSDLQYRQSKHLNTLEKALLISKAFQTMRPPPYPNDTYSLSPNQSKEQVAA